MNLPVRNIQKNLLGWFNVNKRNLPWRKQSAGWYEIFLSEIILQQTQVAQGLPYYQKFIERFPDIGSLARATEDEVLQLWAGLGYYSRARNLLKAARVITEQFNGRFPQTMNKALSLPGVGPYSAAAVLSIAFNQPFAVVDGNVMRVLSRLLLIKEDIRLNATRKEIQHLADSLLDPAQPGDFNEALMELGATVCLPQNPLCSQCPLADFCEAFKSDKQNALPFKSPPPAKRQVKEYVCIIRRNHHYLLRQRPGKGLLARMWEFLTIPVSALNLNEEQVRREAEALCGFSLVTESFASRKIHVYSHIRLEYIPVFFSVFPKEEATPAQGRWIEHDAMATLAIHGAHRKISINN